MNKQIILKDKVAERFEANRIEAERNAGTIDFTENVESMREIVKDLK